MPDFVIMVLGGAIAGAVTSFTIARRRKPAPRAFRSSPSPAVPFGPPYTDVRVAASHVVAASMTELRAVPGLIAVNLRPPASGPEVELTFGTRSGCAPVEEKFIRLRVEEQLLHPNGAVLASRQRAA